MRFGIAARSLLACGLLVTTLSILLPLLFGLQHYAASEVPFAIANKDFANYWMAGKLAIEGKALVLFGPPDAYFAAMTAMFGPEYPWHNWSYPPHAVLPLLPLGLMPYLPALAIFLGVTLSLYLAALVPLDARWSPMSVILLAPFIVANAVTVQNGFLTAGLAIAGLALRNSSPVLAGVLIGCLTFKPQLGFLLPILLISEARWRVILSATATTAALVALSAVTFGWQSWVDYVGIVLPYQSEVMNKLGGDFPFMMGSGLGAGRALGLSPDSAFLVHLPFAAAGLALFGLALWKVEDLRARSFATLLATMLVTPYSVNYDFGAVAAFAALWPLAARDNPAPPYLRLICLAIAILPIVMLPLGKMGLPLTPVILLAGLTALLVSEGVFRRSSLPSPATP